MPESLSDTLQTWARKHVTFERLVLSAIAWASVQGCVNSGQSTVLLLEQRRTPALAPVEYIVQHGAGGSFKLTENALPGETDDMAQLERLAARVARYEESIDQLIEKHRRK